MLSGLGYNFGIGGCGFLIQAIACAKFFRALSFLSEGPTPPVALAPWQDEQFCMKIVLPCAASPPAVCFIPPALAEAFGGPGLVDVAGLLAEQALKIVMPQAAKKSSVKDFAMR